MIGVICNILKYQIIPKDLYFIAKTRNVSKESEINIRSFL